VNSIIEIALTPVVLPLTVLLGFLTAYRLITMLFGLDFDFDIDFDIDVDTDAGFDSSGLDLEDVSNVEIKDKAIIGNTRKKLKWWQILLIFFNFSELPFLFTFTSWVFFWWILTIIGVDLTHGYDNTLGAIILLVAMFASLIINKMFTTPFKAFFRKLERKTICRKRSYKYLCKIPRWRSYKIWTRSTNY